MDQSTSPTPTTPPRKIYQLNCRPLCSPTLVGQAFAKSPQSPSVPDDKAQGRAGGWPRQGPPPAGLTCQNRNNGINPDFIDDSSPASAVVVADRIVNSLPGSIHKKDFALRKRITDMVRMVGANNIAMLTLTRRAPVTDYSEHAAHFKSIMNPLRKMFVAYVRVHERQKRGVWHTHLIVALKDDIRTGTDVQALDTLLKQFRAGQITKGFYYRQLQGLASPALRALWKALRRLCALGEFKHRRKKGKFYKFDACHLMPIVTTPEAMASYVGKYVAKGFEARRPEDKGLRLIGCSRNLSEKTSQNFSWAGGGGRLWRQKVGEVAAMFGIADLDGFAEMFGPRWAYHLRDAITAVPLMRYGTTTMAELDNWDVRDVEGTLKVQNDFTPPLQFYHQRRTKAFNLAMEVKAKRQRRGDNWDVCFRPDEDAIRIPASPSWVEFTCGKDS